MKKEKYGFVYIWRDKVKNRYYIGAHWGTVDDGYICSSNWMRNSYKKRPNDFRRKILFRCNNKNELWNKEYEWLCLIKKNELGKSYYNHNISLHNHGLTIIYEETKLKKSISMKGKNKGKKHSEETKEKLRNRIYSQEYRNKCSERQLGKHISIETEFKKGKMSKENNPFYGKKHSEETKRKISEKIKLINKLKRKDKNDTIS